MDELREKVIKGLECCLNTGNFEECKENCPYFSKDLGISVCSENMRRDALSLLKAQEPRVMTLEEVEKWIETPEERKDPIFVEYGKKMKYGRSGWRTGFFGFSPQHDTHAYGTVLRCWTSRPTDEQRKAVKWDE